MAVVTKDKVSEEEVVVAPTQEPEVETFLPVANPIEVNGEMVKVMPFKLGKVMMMIQFLTDLLDNTNIGNLLVSADSTAVVAELIKELPQIVKVGSPVLLRTIALVLTPDKKLRELEREHEDVRDHLDNYGADLSETIDPALAIDILTLGIQSMGLDTIQRNLPKLAQALNIRR